MSSRAQRREAILQNELGRVNFKNIKVLWVCKASALHETPFQISRPCETKSIHLTELEKADRLLRSTHLLGSAPDPRDAFPYGAPGQPIALKYLTRT